MKQIIFITLSFLTLSSTLLAQDFGAIGTQWYYSEHANGACPGNCEYLHLESVSDTMINGRTTHKITQTYYRFTGDTVYLAPIYLYEHSDTVFVWSSKKSKFLISYIFNGNIGDTLMLDAPDTLHWTDSTYSLVIDTIINVSVDGVSLKKYGTTALDDYKFFNGGGYFMDKLGGLGWFFPRAGILPEAGGPIRCYSDAQVDTNFQAVPCDHLILSSINEHGLRNSIQIYPNPTRDKLTIDSEYSIDHINVFDLRAKLLLTTQTLTIDLSSFSSGQYILEISLSTGEKVEKKIIKNSP